MVEHYNNNPSKGFFRSKGFFFILSSPPFIYPSMTCFRSHVVLKEPTRHHTIDAQTQWNLSLSFSWCFSDLVTHEGNKNDDLSLRETTVFDIPSLLPHEQEEESLNLVLSEHLFGSMNPNTTIMTHGRHAVAFSFEKNLPFIVCVRLGSLLMLLMLSSSFSWKPWKDLETFLRFCSIYF